MVNLKLLVNIIAEDVYLQSLESLAPPSSLPLRGQKKLVHPVKYPEQKSVGLLANEIKLRFQKMYGYPLGEVKYIKDDELDADLDPEMSAYDAFVDEGLAEKDPKDQRAAMKIVYEKEGRKFGVREGSVVPDLSNPHFQPRHIPPPPLFRDAPNPPKRSLDEAFEGDTFRSQGRPFKSPRPPTRPSFADSAIPSVERDSVIPGERYGPVVIPGTQDSPPRRLSDYGDRGSVILGDSEYRPQPPNFENPRQRAVTVPHHLMDIDEANVEQEVQDSPQVQRSRGRSRRSGGRVDQEHTSGSSSNYYSVTSESQGVPRLNGQDVLQERPLTPPSEALRQRRPSKVLLDQADYSVETGSVKQPLSARFQRARTQSRQESEIEDSQMSPQSRKSGKGPRKSAELVPVAERGMRESSSRKSSAGLGESLIRDGQGPSNGKFWDFSSHVPDLTDLDKAEAHPSRRQKFSRARRSTDSPVVEPLVSSTNKPKSLPRAKKTARTSNTPSRPDARAADSHLIATEAPLRVNPMAVMVDPVHRQIDDSDKENVTSGPTTALMAPHQVAVVNNGIPHQPKQNTKFSSGEARRDINGPIFFDEAHSSHPTKKLTPSRGHEVTVHTEEGPSSARRKNGESKKRSKLGEPGQQLSQELRASVEAVDKPVLPITSIVPESRQSVPRGQSVKWNVRPPSLNAPQAPAKTGLLSNGGDHRREEHRTHVSPATQGIMELMSEESSSEERTEDESLDKANGEPKEKVVGKAKDSGDESEEESEEESAEEVLPVAEVEAEEAEEASDSLSEEESEADSEQGGRAEVVKGNDVQFEKQEEAEAERSPKNVSQRTFGEQLQKLTTRSGSDSETPSTSGASESAQSESAGATSKSSSHEHASLPVQTHSHRPPVTEPEDLPHSSSMTVLADQEMEDEGLTLGDEAHNQSSSEPESEEEVVPAKVPNMDRRAVVPPTSTVDKKSKSAKGKAVASTAMPPNSNKLPRGPNEPPTVAALSTTSARPTTSEDVGRVPILPPGYSMELYQSQKMHPGTPPTFPPPQTVPPPQTRQSTRVAQQSESRTPSTDRAGSGTPVPANRPAGQPSKLRDQVTTSDQAVTPNATSSAKNMIWKEPITAAMWPIPPRKRAKRDAKEEAKTAVKITTTSSGLFKLAPKPAASLPNTAKKVTSITDFSDSGAAAPSPLAEFSSKRQKEREQTRLLSSQSSLHSASATVAERMSRNQSKAEDSDDDDDDDDSDSEESSELEELDSVSGGENESEFKSGSDSEAESELESDHGGVKRKGKGKASKKQPTPKAGKGQAPLKVPAKPPTKTPTKAPTKASAKASAKTAADALGSLAARNARAVANTKANTTPSTHRAPTAKAETARRASTTKLPAIKGRSSAKKNIVKQMSAAKTSAHAARLLDMSIRDVEPETSDEEDSD